MVAVTDALSCAVLTLSNAMTPAIVTAHLQQRLEPLLSHLIKPDALARIAMRMPAMLNSFVVEKLVNSAFAEQIGDGDFDFLGGKRLQVEIIDAGLFVGLSFENGSITCQHFNRHPQTADATLSIQSNHAIQLIQQEVDPDTLFFQRRLKINGDTELAHQVKNTIDTLDPGVIPSFILKLVSQYRLRVLNEVG
jgi:predicted lipid carrier protein YhbT